jgi:hypothetical protein
MAPNVWANSAGFIGAVLFAAALPVSVQLLGKGQDLGAWLRGRGPYQAVAETASPEAFRVFPSDRAARVRVDEPASTDAPGLYLRTRKLTFGQQWEQEITVPLYRGPLVSAESPICGYRLGVGEEVFSTPSFRELALKQVKEQWARVREMAGRENVTIGDLSKFAFEAKLVNPGLVVDFAAEDSNGAGLSAKLVFRIQAGSGRLVVTNAAPPQVNVTARLAGLARNEGSRRADDAGILGSFFGDYARGAAEGQLRALAQSKAGEMASFAASLATQQFARLGSFPSPIPGRPKDTFSLVVSEQPVVANGRLSVAFCLAAHVDTEGAATSGPNEIVYRNAKSPTLPEAELAKGAPRVELAMNGDAMNQVLFVLWKTGALRDTGGQLLVSAKKDKSVDQMLDQLDFDLHDLEPTLPPVVAEAEGSQVAITAAGIRVGQAKRSTRKPGEASYLAVHAEALGTLAAEGEDIVVRGDLREPSPGEFALHANCVQATPGLFTLSSCVGDLLPIAKSEWARFRAKNPPPSLRLPIGTLVQSLAQGGLFTGLSVKVGKPTIETRGSPLGLYGRMELDIGAASTSVVPLLGTPLPGTPVAPARSVATPPAALPAAPATGKGTLP